MTKKCRLILLSLTLAISLLACVCLLTACIKPQDTSVTYTVTVKTDATTPAQGVKVQISKGGVKFGSPVTTDANGKAEFKLEPDSYTFSLDDLPDGYNADGADLTLTAEKTSATITLNKNVVTTVEYKVKLVDQNGAAYYHAGVTVMICTIEAGNAPGTCLTPVALGSDGIATIQADPYNYHAKINSLPENIKYDSDSDGYYTKETFSATKTELTITVFTVTSVNDSAKMSDSDKTAFADKMLSYTPDTDLDAYHFEATIAPGKAAYYAFTPAIDGDYMLYYTSGGSANYLLKEGAFSSGNQGTGIFMAMSNLLAGHEYLLTVLNLDDEEPMAVEFVIESAKATHITVNMLGDITVTIAKEGAKAHIAYLPSIGASFKLTGPADKDVSIVETDFYFNATHADDSYVKNAECSARFTEEHIGSTGFVCFSVAVKNVSEYPVTFTVTLDKIQNLKNTVNEKHAEATLEDYDEQEGTLTYVPLDGTAQLVKDDSGVYHLGTETGPVVVVMLTQNLPLNRLSTKSGAALAYIDKNDSYSLIIDVTEDKTSLTQGNTFNDYCLMIRGFVDYKETPVLPSGTIREIPDNITEQHYYAKHVNDDGVYPLTDELKTFLQEFAAMYADKITATEGSEWLFACCYYSDETPGPGIEDAIVGEYKFVSGIIEGDEVKVGDTTEVWDETQQTYVEGTIGADEYKLVVSKDGTFVISKLNRQNQYDEVSSGEWSKTADSYSFVIPDGTVDLAWNPIDLEFDVTYDAEAGTIRLAYELDELDWNFAKPSEGNDDPIVGEYSMGNQMMGNLTTLTVNSNGTYSISNSMMGTATGTWLINDDGTYAFVHSINDWDYEYTVTRNAADGSLKFHDDSEDDPDYFEYEFDAVNSEDDPTPEDKDPIVGEYSMGNQMMGNLTTLTVNSNGTYSISNSMMGTATGTWLINEDGTYAFVHSINDWDYEYTVTRNAADSSLKFHDDSEDDPDYFEYEFDAVNSEDDPTPEDKDPIVGEYSMGNKMLGNEKTLTVNEDYSFSIVEAMGTITGTWASNGDGTYAFIAPGDPFDYEYTVTRNATDGSLKFHDNIEEDEEEFAYEFEVVSEEA